ncbi:MAG: DUF423 domain-containing protein [Bryobacterales bacterium]|nr:DUF423 domain-containing protein [Bryobacterales bacterium]
MNWSGFGAIALALAVSMGAFGAHSLRAKLDAYSMDVYEKAVFYHFIHAFGLLIAPLLARAGLLTTVQAGRACLLLALGILIFPGTLYALAITGARWLGAITPLGGLSFIAGWLVLAWGLFRVE